MRKLILAGLASAIAAPAFAHPGHGAEGLAAGLVHPLLGADHLTAMLAVGIWSGLAVPRHPWSGAAAFLLAMIGGAGLAWAGIALPMAEGGILLSVVVLGLLVTTAHRDLPVATKTAALAAIAVFGAFHGHAHASETAGSAAAYGAGFLMTTALLHLGGIGIARLLSERAFGRGLLGGMIAASGLLLIAG